MKKEELWKFSNEALLKEEKRSKSLYYMSFVPLICMIVVFLIKVLKGDRIQFEFLFLTTFIGLIPITASRLKAISEEVKARNLK